MQAILIILLTVVASIVYGIAHDQVTARVCVEYFTIGHPRIIDSESPTLLAFAWGILATWWVGLIGGIILATAARSGSRPQQRAGQLVRPLVWLLGTMAMTSVIAGVAGLSAAESGAVFLLQPMASMVPGEKHVAFIANLWAHVAAYFAGFVGVIVLAILTWRRRGQLEVTRQ
jgi:hypothetical protein